MTEASAIPSQPRVLVPSNIWAPAVPKDARRVTVTGTAMATAWNVTLISPPAIDVAKLQRGIEDVLARVVAQMSPWVADSDISRFNRLGAGEWQTLPAAFATVMRCALDVAGRSAGAFDPTAGGVVNAWGFGTRVRFDDPGFTIPRDQEVDQHRLGWNRLQLDTSGRLLQPGGFVLNLSAIAKGFAVDAVSGYLDACGVPCHLVDIGGELRGSGVKPDLQPWWIEVEPPEAQCPLPPTRIALSSLAVATSGDYRRFVTVNGQRLPHTIDPRTRRPVRHGLASVTVVHESCMWADAWSTALMVLGPKAGLDCADREAIAALLRWRTPDGGWAEAASRGLRAMES